jgi:hypothetical protein
MNRITGIISALLWLATSLTAADVSDVGAAANSDRPNVLLFLIDDLGWRDVGCYGSTYYRTPNIDQLAADGIRFTNGYAACNVCSPTRAAILK